MKNPKGSIAVWVVVLLVVLVLGGGYWYWQQNAAQPTTSATQLIATTTAQAQTSTQTTTQKSSSNTYTNAAYGFAVTYPTSLSPITNAAQMTTQSYFGSTFTYGFTPLVQFKIKKQSAANPNGSIEGDLQVSATTDISPVSACAGSYPDKGDLAVNHQGVATINGTSFTEVDGTDSATSNEFTLYSYGAVRSGVCYKIEIVAQGSAYTQSDAASMVNSFMPVVQSFKFVGTPTIPASQTSSNSAANTTPTDQYARDAIEYNDHTFTWVPANGVQDAAEVQFTVSNGTVTATEFGTVVTFAGVDPTTFMVAVHPDGTVTSFAKDATHIYDIWNGSVFAGADPQTFSVLADIKDDPEGSRTTLAKDKNNVYAAGGDSAYQNGVVSGADAATFVYLGDGFLKDKSWLYTVGNSRPTNTLVDIASFVWVGGPWFKDKNQAYSGSGMQNPPLSPFAADVATFQGLNSLYAKDSQHVYFYSDLITQPYEVLAGADPATFTVVSGQSTYDAQDKNHTYLRGKIVQ